MLYKYGLFLTLKTRFKASRAPLGPKWTISTQLGAGRYKWYQSRSPTWVWGFVWPRNLVGHNEGVVFAWGGVCDIPYRIGGKVPSAI